MTAHRVDRRDFFRIGGAALAAGATGIAGRSAAAMAASPSIAAHRQAALPKAKGPRLVVVGGGTSGLTVAKYAKKEHPDFDVVLVEKRVMYSSCFSSNLWYADLINLEFLAKHSFLDAAVNNRYIYFNATVTGLDRDSKIVVTSEGDIAYDYLVVAPGISYDYDKIGVTDVENRTRLRQMYPAGFIWPTEHVTINRKLHEFTGGVFVQTVPNGNYRCLAAPYERACLIASMIERRRIQGKVLILDANPQITTKAAAFHRVFDTLYQGIVEWIPSIRITGIDVDKRAINTTFDSYPFDDAAIYPNIRASTLIEKLGLMAPPERTAQKEADIDVRFYNMLGDPYVYVIGDARRQPFSKSGNTANTEAHYVAKVLAARAQGKEILWESPETVCFSVLSTDPTRTISTASRYVYDPEKDVITGHAEASTMHRDLDTNGSPAKEWAERLYRDMFQA